MVLDDKAFDPRITMREEPVTKLPAAQSSLQTKLLQRAFGLRVEA